MISIPYVLWWIYTTSIPLFLILPELLFFFAAFSSKTVREGSFETGRMGPWYASSCHSYRRLGGRIFRWGRHYGDWASDTQWNARACQMIWCSLLVIIQSRLMMKTERAMCMSHELDCVQLGTNASKDFPLYNLPKFWKEDFHIKTLSLPLRLIYVNLISLVIWRRMYFFFSSKVSTKW